MSATKLLDATLLELEDTWGFTREELSDIQDKLLLFASTVSSNEALAKEVQKLAEDL